MFKKLLWRREGRQLLNITLFALKHLLETCEKTSCGSWTPYLPLSPQSPHSPTPLPCLPRYFGKPGNFLALFHFPSKLLFSYRESPQSFWAIGAAFSVYVAEDFRGRSKYLSTSYRFWMSSKRGDIGIFTCMYRESNVRGVVLHSWSELKITVDKITRWNKMLAFGNKIKKIYSPCLRWKKLSCTQGKEIRRWNIWIFTTSLKQNNSSFAVIWK